MLKLKKYIKAQNRIFFILFILFSGCSIEHQISINMDTNKYSIDYFQLREFDDIPFLLPGDIDNWEEIESSDTKLYYRNTLNYGDPIGNLFTLNDLPSNEIIDQDIKNPNMNSEIILSKLAEIMKENYFIFSNYNFDFTFKNRRVSHHYDKLFNYYSGFYDDVKSENNSNKNTNTTDGYDDIVHQLVGFLFLETLNKSDIEFNKKAIYLNSLKNWDDQINISSQLDKALTGIKVNKLFEILLNAEEYLYSLADKNDLPQIKKIWDEVEFEILITHLLLFNNFVVELNIPGTLISHNADSTFNNALYWNIDIDQFLNSDYTLHAKSKIYHKNRLLFVILLLISIGIFFIRSKMKK